MPESKAPVFKLIPNGLRLTLRLQPGARRDAVEGLQTLADGRRAIKARVTAPPGAGKANAAAVKLLAKAWRLPKSAVTIVGGATDRTKILEIAGDPAALAPRLQDWLGGLERQGASKESH